MHVLVTFATDHGADNLIFARQIGNFQNKFLYARFEFEVPVGKFRSIFFANERKPVNGSVSVLGLRLLRRDAKLHLFAGS